jgi:hypothetical protein
MICLAHEITDRSDAIGGIYELHNIIATARRFRLAVEGAHIVSTC